MRWCFGASGVFGANVLEQMVKLKLMPDVIISLPDRKMGRNMRLTPVPAKDRAQKLGLKIREVVSKEELPDILAGFDIAVVCDFGIIFSQDALKAARCINIHPSLLPKWRGPAPIYWTILSGDEKTGVTIIDMAQKVDAGPVLMQEETRVLDRESYSSLQDRLAAMSARMTGELFEKLDSLDLRTQDDNLATYARFISKEDARILFSEDDIYEIDRKIRAFEAGYGAYCFLAGKRFKIYKAALMLKERPDGNFGEASVESGNLYIKCKGGYLMPLEIQVEGRKRMSCSDFVKGARQQLKTAVFD